MHRKTQSRWKAQGPHHEKGKINIKKKEDEMKTMLITWTYMPSDIRVVRPVPTFRRLPLFSFSRFIFILRKERMKDHKSKQLIVVNTIKQYFSVALFIINTWWFKLLSLWMKSWSVNIQMEAVRQFILTVQLVF